MRIALLTQFLDNESTRKIVRAGEARGHTVDVVNYLECHMTIEPHAPQLHGIDGNALPKPDAVIPRVSSLNTFYGTAVLRQLQMAGVYTPNSSEAILRSRDKLRSLQLLSRKGIPMPKTAFGNASTSTQALIDSVGGAPVVVKILEGTQGIGVVLCESNNAALSVMEAFASLKTNILVQEFIAESEGSDIRCLVVGKRVVGSMIRRAAPGEFRANLHRGGKGEAYKLSPQQREIAVKAARAMNLGVAGVDLVHSDRGPLVIEVNSSPGLVGIEASTEKDIAGTIIEHVIKEAAKGAKEDRTER